MYRSINQGQSPSSDSSTLDYGHLRDLYINPVRSSPIPIPQSSQKSHLMQTSLSYPSDSPPIPAVDIDDRVSHPKVGDLSTGKSLKRLPSQMALPSDDTKISDNDSTSINSPDDLIFQLDLSSPDANKTPTENNSQTMPSAIPLYLKEALDIERQLSWPPSVNYVGRFTLTVV